ncbi:MAG: hypothetical protein COY40_03785 [Alphaproteobacteria bacterium CG_4_10_14_0_8_um_filter_53_9]|nr:MAG: hypothetical protein COY40_03785 [Alphaproteobacteria bacterium CG_4_10_14_0_8_um_filter_53_9]
MKLMINTAFLAAFAVAAHAETAYREQIYIRPSGYQTGYEADYRPYAKAAPTLKDFWNGTSVGVHVVTGDADVESTRASGNVRTFEAKGTGYGATLARDWRSNNFVMGVAADVGNRNAKGHNDTYLGQKDSAKLGLSGTARARLGVILGGRTLAYVTGGFTATRSEYDVYSNGVNRSTTQTETLTGPMYGAGLQMAINAKTAAHVEIRQTSYGKAHKHDASAVNGARTYKLDDTAVMMGLSRKLSF